MNAFAARLVAITLAVVLLLGGCAPAPAAIATQMPKQTAATAVPVANTPISIVLPDWNQSTFIAVNRHFSGLMAKKGWNIEFYTVRDSYESTESSYMKYVTTQLTSGKASADGYIIPHAIYNVESNQQVNQLVNAGQLLDVKAVAAKIIPDYFTKYKKLVDKSIAGLPVGIIEYRRNDKYIFTVRNDLLNYLPEKTYSYKDVYSYIKKLNEAYPGKYYIIAPYDHLLNIWAIEKGYMPLDLFQRGRYVYAAVDDPDAKPVLLEKLPGFQDFLTSILDMYGTGYLLSSINVENNYDIAAELSVFNRVYDYFLVSSKGGTFLSYPLYTNEAHAYGVGRSDEANMVYAYEMAIPAKSRNAEGVMKFVEWMYSAQANYDTVVLGQEGVDYSLSQNRLKIDDILSKVYHPSDANQLWPGFFYFQNNAFFRIYDTAPVNAELIKDSWNEPPCAAPYLVDAYPLRDIILAEPKFDDETDKMMQHRIALFSDIDQSTFGENKLDIKLFLWRLSKLNNAAVIKAYEAKVKQLRDTYKK